MIDVVLVLGAIILLILVIWAWVPLERYFVHRDHAAHLRQQRDDDPTKLDFWNGKQS